MRTISITIQETQKSYPIFIGENILEKISELFDFKKYSKIAIITDDQIAKLFLEKLQKAIPYVTHPIILPSGEKAKNIETVIKIWQELLAQKFDRKSLVINLGGGVIGDMGGFAASTYMRGIDFLQIPTTLLSQVDASVGGKVGINFEGIKNMIGSFQQPKGILVDVTVLNSLPERIYEEGFGEIIKHGLIADKDYFNFITEKTMFTPEEIIEIIYKSIEMKKHVVEQDEKEGGYRKILNFGHTVGHALEALSFETDHPLLHGEAVFLGMIAETKISELAGILPKEESEIILEKLSKISLPQRVDELEKSSVLEKMQTDKKNEHGTIKLTLLKHIGEAIIDQEITDEIIQKGLEEIL
jgi:3-dehydroquinate synthase